MPRSRNLGNPVGAEMEGKEDLTGGKRVVRKEEKTVDESGIKPPIS